MRRRATHSLARRLRRPHAPEKTQDHGHFLQLPHIQGIRLGQRRKRKGAAQLRRIHVHKHLHIRIDKVAARIFEPQILHEPHDNAQHQ